MGRNWFFYSQGSTTTKNERKACCVEWPEQMEVWTHAVLSMPKQTTEMGEEETDSVTQYRRTRERKTDRQTDLPLLNLFLCNCRRKRGYKLLKCYSIMKQNLWAPLSNRLLLFIQWASLNVNTFYSLIWKYLDIIYHFHLQQAYNRGIPKMFAPTSRARFDFSFIIF